MTGEAVSCDLTAIVHSAFFQGQGLAVSHMVPWVSSYTYAYLRVLQNCE